MPVLLTSNIVNALRSPVPAISLAGRELHQKDRCISPLIEQSSYQIITNHPELELSVRSIYTYLDMEILTARNIDLKRKVKFKIHKTQISDRRAFQGRAYANFQPLGLSFFAEMDTMHSASGSSKTLLTFFFYKRKTISCLSDEPYTEGAV